MFFSWKKRSRKRREKNDPLDPGLVVCFPFNFISLINIPFKQKNSIIITYNHLVPQIKQALSEGPQKKKEAIDSKIIGRIFGEKREQASVITKNELEELQKISNITPRAIYEHNYNVLLRTAEVRQKGGQRVTIQQLKG